MKFQLEKLIPPEEFERTWSDDYRKYLENHMLNEIGYESAKQTITISESEDEHGKRFHAEMHCFSKDTMEQIIDELKWIGDLGNYEAKIRVKSIAKLIGLT